MNGIIKRIKSKGMEHILFMGATIFSSGVHFLYSIYVKAYVSPLEYGIYSTCMILTTYMAYLQLGTVNSFNRDYPQLIGAKKMQEASEYSNTILSFLLMMYLSATVLLTVGFFAVGKALGWDSKLRTGFILAAAISTVSIIENIGNYKYRIEKGFYFPSIVLLTELVSVLLGVFLVPKLGYYALYFTTLISFAIGVVLYHRNLFHGFRFRIDTKVLYAVLLSGLPLLFNGLIWTVINSIDKFVILGFMDIEALGLYGIAQNAFSYMVLIPSSMSQLFFVQMGKEYGSTGRKETLTEVSVRYASILAGITSFVAMLAYFFLPMLVKSFMPSYEEGVLSAQILILGLSIYAATLINGNILTILKKNRALLFNSICMCVFNAVCSVLYVYVVGRRIESVALGTATSYIVCSFIIILQVHKHSGCRLSLLIKSSVVPVCISLIPCVVIFETIANKVIGFIIAAIVVGLYYVLRYKKQITAIIKESK